MNKKDRQRLEALAKRGGVPFGNFRCDICGKPWPCEEVAGTMINYGTKKVYTVCSFCKSSFGLVLFPSGFLGHGVDENGHGYVDWDKIQINEQPPTA